MASRAFRARPLDVSKALEIVTDLALLDSTEGLPARDVVHNHAALDADNEKVRLPSPPLPEQHLGAVTTPRGPLISGHPPPGGGRAAAPAILAAGASRVGCCVCPTLRAQAASPPQACSGTNMRLAWLLEPAGV